MSAKPLNVGANGKPAPSSVAKKAGTSDTKTPAKATAAVKPEEISSPHELTAFVSLFPTQPSLSGLNYAGLVSQVEHLLSQLETKFDDMSNQVLDKSTSYEQKAVLPA